MIIWCAFEIQFCIAKIEYRKNYTRLWIDLFFSTLSSTDTRALGIKRKIRLDLDRNQVRIEGDVCTFFPEHYFSQRRHDNSKCFQYLWNGNSFDFLILQNTILFNVSSHFFFEFLINNILINDWRTKWSIKIWHWLLINFFFFWHNNKTTRWEIFFLIFAIHSFNNSGLYTYKYGILIISARGISVCVSFYNFSTKNSIEEL